MKFVYEEHDNYTSFTAIPENEWERDGLRAQGPYTPISLKQDSLIVKYVSKNALHPDIVAAICITAFYPFIHSSATMPFPVSKRFADGLQMDILPQHDKVDGIYRATEPITIDNIDIKLEPYTEGSNTVVAYGGGMDSTAIACLFPEYDLIHSTDIDNTDNTVQKFVEDNLKNKIHTIETNCKYLATPKGFTTFTNIYITPLIMSADLNIKNIMCGAILGSTCLSNGTKYFPQFDPSRRNRWERFYNHIGLCMFSPTAGCSELITAKIICKYDLQYKVIYCDRSNGKPCNKCTKCLRKQLELAYHGADIEFDSFEQDFITSFLKKRPLYFGHIFIETINHLLKRFTLCKDTTERTLETTSDDKDVINCELCEKKTNSDNMIELRRETDQCKEEFILCEKCFQEQKTTLRNEYWDVDSHLKDDDETVSKKQEEIREKILNICLYLFDAISDLHHLDTALFNNIYAKSFQYFPDDIKNKIIERLTCYANIISPEEELYLEKWDITIQPKNEVESIKAAPVVEQPLIDDSQNISDEEKMELDIESSLKVDVELNKEHIDLMTELQYLREENTRIKINSNTIRQYLLKIFQLIECDTDVTSGENIY